MRCQCISSCALRPAHGRSGSSTSSLTRTRAPQAALRSPRRDRLTATAPLAGACEWFSRPAPLPPWLRTGCTYLSDSTRADQGPPLQVHAREREPTVSRLLIIITHEFAGSVVEHCPAGLSLVTSLAQRIAADGGAALIIDYCRSSSSPGDAPGMPCVGATVRGISRQAFVDPLSAPGEVDLVSGSCVSERAIAATHAHRRPVLPPTERRR